MDSMASMTRFWSERARRLVPYVPGEQPRQTGLVKLNTNENPYPPSPLAVAAIRAAAGDTLRLYPDPGSTDLCEAVARWHRVAVGQVFAGNGSDEVLAFAFAALLGRAGGGGERGQLLFPDVTYSFYPVYGELFDIAWRAVPLDDGFGLRLDDYIRRQPAAAIFPNPNAPTGVALPRGEIERLLRDCPDTLLVVDEAYTDFGAESAIPLIERYPNLLVVRTLSKSHSLAGLRIGYAVGDAVLIAALRRVKDSFNSYPVDRLAAAGAAAALDDVAYFEQTRAAIVASREVLARGLHELGLQVLPSTANFLYARHPRWGGAALTAAVRERGVLIRHFAQPTRCADFVRISVGTQPQCAVLLETMAGVVR